MLTGRPQDAWLATWSQADLAVPHPLDPIVRSPTAVAELARRRAARRRRRLSAVSADAAGGRRHRPGRPSHLAAGGAGPDGGGRGLGDGPDHGRRGQPAQVAGFLVALRAKGETVDEMRGLADTMLAHASRIEVAGPSLDIVGTGGDRAHTVNISTMAVDRGRRRPASAWSSTATGPRRPPRGSADVLEALGVTSTLTPGAGGRVAAEAGITFCFAQTFHPSMRHAAACRAASSASATAFNFLGPLTNPAQPTYAADRRGRPADGAADGRRLRRPRARTRAGLPRRRRPRRAHHLDDLVGVVGARRRRSREHAARPRGSSGLRCSPLETLRGGDAVHNAGVVTDVLAGAPGRCATPWC